MVNGSGHGLLWKTEWIERRRWGTLPRASEITRDMDGDRHSGLGRSEMM